MATQNKRAVSAGTLTAQGAKNTFMNTHNISRSTCQEPRHGRVKQCVWRKNVRGSKHLLRYPKPAWAFDESDLARVKALGVTTIELHDKDFETYYRTPLTNVLKYGKRFDRGHGPQVSLELRYWKQAAGKQQQSSQLTLFGGTA